MGHGFQDLCCGCVVEYCCICEDTCKELCEEYERSKLDETQKPQSNQVQKGELTPCLLGLMITFQIILVIALILAKVFQLKTRFYYVTSNILWCTIGDKFFFHSNNYGKHFLQTYFSGYQIKKFKPFFSNIVELI